MKKILILIILSQSHLTNAFNFRQACKTINGIRKFHSMPEVLEKVKSFKYNLNKIVTENKNKEFLSQNSSLINLSQELFDLEYIKIKTKNPNILNAIRETESSKKMYTLRNLVKNKLNLQHNYDCDYYDNDDHKEKSQFYDSGKLVQKLMGIPDKYSLPIFNNHYHNSIAGSANFDAMNLNDSLLLKLPFGYRNHVLLHEAVHIKYNHVLISYILHQYYFPIKKIKEIDRFMEREADSFACKFSNCYKCTLETANNKSNDEFMATYDGYLTKQELISIAALQMGKNLLCEYHQMHKS